MKEKKYVFYCAKVDTLIVLRKSLAIPLFGLMVKKEFNLHNEFCFLGEL